MHEFQVLFDKGEHSRVLDPVFARYGRLGFPAPLPERPWTFANFVQTIDGVVSLLGRDASGGDISQSEDDRWLMDLLRAHADAVMLGTGTLKLETARQHPRPRGPVFRIVDPTLRQLRGRLRPGPERNIFVTGQGDLMLADHCVFDADSPVQTMIVTSPAGAARLEPQLSSAYEHVKLLVTGAGSTVNLAAALRQLREHFGIEYLLCEGGPKLYSSLLAEHLIDEKFLTVSPIECGQHVPAADDPEATLIRPTVAFDLALSKQDAVRWHWLSARRIGDYQFHRYRRA